MLPRGVPYVDAWRKREAQSLAEDAAFRQRIVERLPEVVALLRAHGATRIVLFGSFADDQARVDSDVDLLVVGIKSSALFRVAAEVDAVLLETHVDLVPVESAHALALEHAERYGKVVYESPSRT